MPRWAPTRTGWPEARAPNLGIVTAYNDMLSAHQPFETLPALIRAAARAAGGTAQVAGGVPAMCDGVTQGQPGMELSLFSRDVIALAAGVALSHNCSMPPSIWASATRSCRGW
jgi:phosphogluconate dehydratase